MGVETEEQPVPKVFRGALLKPARALGRARVPPAVVAVSPETRSKLHPPTTAAAAGAAAGATLRQSSFHGIGMHGLRTQPMIKLLVTSEVVSASVAATNGANASIAPAASASAASAASTAAFVDATALTTLLRCRHRPRHTQASAREHADVIVTQTRLHHALRKEARKPATIFGQYLASKLCACLRQIGWLVGSHAREVTMWIELMQREQRVEELLPITPKPLLGVARVLLRRRGGLRNPVARKHVRTQRRAIKRRHR